MLRPSVITSHRRQFPSALLAVPLRRHVHRSSLYALECLLDRVILVDRRHRRRVLGIVGLKLRTARAPRRGRVLVLRDRFEKRQLVDGRLAGLLITVTLGRGRRWRRSD